LVVVVVVGLVVVDVVVGLAVVDDLVVVTVVVDLAVVVALELVLDLELDGWGLCENGHECDGSGLYDGCGNGLCECDGSGLCDGRGQWCDTAEDEDAGGATGAAAARRAAPRTRAAEMQRMSSDLMGLSRV
jgi:hypothetical protein